MLKIISKNTMALAMMCSLGLSSCQFANSLNDGEQRVKLRVENSEGGKTDIYLKSNPDWTVISESGSMDDLWDADKNVFSDTPHLCYKVEQGELNIVWFDEDSTFLEHLDTKAKINYIWEPRWTDSVQSAYLSKGYKAFPEE